MVTLYFFVRPPVTRTHLWPPQNERALTIGGSTAVEPSNSTQPVTFYYTGKTKQPPVCVSASRRLFSQWCTPRDLNPEPID
ncbi:hypothetical protein ARTHRO9AX_180199 [Arthrobacter sp. 9AX]|nr:hypothetical protein ARTHRO9AX_180199 [Arthrobacter sp. 9AX]